MTDLLKPEEAADRLRISREALRAWQYKGYGPKAIFLSARIIRYKADDVEEFIRSQKEASGHQHKVG